MPQTNPLLLGLDACAAPCHTGVRKGLSRISGNRSVRFLEEGAAVTSFPYSTGRSYRMSKLPWEKRLKSLWSVQSGNCGMGKRVMHSRSWHSCETIDIIGFKYCCPNSVNQ